MSIRLPRPCRCSAVRRWLPTAAARVRFRAACGVCGGQSGTGAGFPPSTSVSPANHSTDFSIIIITRGWHSMPISGRSAEWTQLDSTPHYINYVPQEQGGPVIPLGTGFPFLRLLRLARLRWKYSNPPPHGHFPLLSSNPWDPRYIALDRPQQKTLFPNNSFIVVEMPLPRRCIKRLVLLLRACSFSR
jgi:hypothetical protein